MRICSHKIILYIPFWLNLYQSRQWTTSKSRKLYIPFWLNLYALLAKSTCDSDAALHSILVKSILMCVQIDKRDIGALHSILVKSIPYIDAGPWWVNTLYIPFWLNLYAKLYIAIYLYFLLYIPFWLNLYDDTRRYVGVPCCLYIPFWLNLYCVNIRQMVLLRCTLHSILVKSILFLRWMDRRKQVSLHSILVKSIHTSTSILKCSDIILYIPFWLNLYSIMFYVCTSVTTLHSILVKSILGLLLFCIAPSCFTFHSG